MPTNNTMARAKQTTLALKLKQSKKFMTFTPLPESSWLLPFVGTEAYKEKIVPCFDF